MDYTYMHCNFSKYMFNYFKYSEQYLLSFDNTISETQLSTYGTAIKTHDEIIMVMLGTLREISDHHNAKDLITVNLYLNNVSGSLNMIAKNDNGEFSRSEISKHLLKGYKIIHQSIVQRLEYFIEDKCSNVSFDNDFILYTNFKKPIEYSSENLHCVLEQLKNKIINDMKIYLTLRDIHSLENNPLLENYNVIMKYLALAYESKKYNRFHPKYYLFYDLMEKRPHNFELDLASGSQAKQRASYNDDGQLSDILDELRFTPILKTSEINYRIKLLDIFRFVKFDFDLINIETFQLLVNTAATRPILSALRSYVVLINVFIHQNKAVQFYLKDKIIKMGEDITALINAFMDLNLFKCNFKKKMRYIFNKTFYFIESLKDLNDLFINEQARKLLTYVDLIMKRKYLCFKFNHFDKTYDVEDSITEVIDSTAKKIYALSIYIEKLKEYQYCFDIANNYLTLKNLNILTFKKVLKHTIPYAQLGNYEDIYRPLYFPNDNTNDRKLHNNEVFGDENYNDEKNNEDNEVIEIKNETFYSPKYLEDYLLFV
ncbi:protein PFC0760c-like isoform X2 [Daktulosphaira vitifoliae]|nr:protein PFC0760c-like isoform X2 [Daktulosphaira vitifoliae]